MHMPIENLALQALTAQASYAELPSGSSATALVAALMTERGGFTATQADEFAAKYAVVLQYDDRSLGGNNTGLSLTVFEDNDTHQLTSASRRDQPVDARYQQAQFDRHVRHGVVASSAGRAQGFAQRAP